jgi:hypothetical protein
MARSKFGYSSGCFRIEPVQVGHPAFTDAVGTDRLVVITVPLNAVWEIMTISATLTTTATVGNRNQRFRITDSGGLVYFQRFSGVTTAASGFINTNYAPGMPELAYSALPIGLVLPPSFRILINLSTGVDIADTHVVTALFKEYC